MLDKGRAVVAVDPFPDNVPMPLTDKKAKNSNPPYVGMVLCYNRSVLAERVHDLLTVVTWAKSWSKGGKVSLVGCPGSGPAALLAKALAGDAIDRAAVDLGGFDFDQVRAETSPMLLPGGLKYGGILGFVPLCSSGQTLVSGAPQSARSDLAARAPGVTLKRQSPTTPEMVNFLTR